MTHHQHPNAVRQAVQALAESGFDGMAQAMELLLNECMKIERQQALGVGPYPRRHALSQRRLAATPGHRRAD